MGLEEQSKTDKPVSQLRQPRCLGLWIAYVGIMVPTVTLVIASSNAQSQEPSVVDTAQSTPHAQAIPSPTEKKSEGGLVVSESVVQFPPLTRDAIDYFFDSLRSGGQFEPVPLRESQQVAKNIVGIWAGAQSTLDSSVGLITLRFRPRAEARLERVESGKTAIGLAESFDVELEMKSSDCFIRHSLATSKLSRTGLVVDLKENRATPVLVEFVAGHRDAGIYFAWPPTILSSAQRAWSLLVCPRLPRYVQQRRSDYARLELRPSPYELREVDFTLTAGARARIPPTDRPERVAVTIFTSENLPRPNQNRDEVKSLSPSVEVPYRPASAFGFMTLPALSGHLQEGVLAKIETENPAGYIRRQFHSHVVYVHRLEEPSPVSVIIGEHRATRDEGACYIISVQRSTWNHYDRLPRDPAPVASPSPRL